MSNWYKKRKKEAQAIGGGIEEARYFAVINADVYVQADPDRDIERKRALEAVYSKLYEGEASADDGTLAFVKMSYQSVDRYMGR